MLSLIRAFLLWFVPYERVTVHSRLDQKTAMLRVSSLLRAEMPIPVPMGKGYAYYNFTGWIKGQRFYIRDYPSPKEEGDPPFRNVTGVIESSDATSVITATMHLDLMALTVYIVPVAVLLAYLFEMPHIPLAVPMLFWIVTHGALLAYFKLSSSGTRSVLWWLFSVPEADRIKQIWDQTLSR
ncbi:MAG: hypothetical protein WCF84_03010 [Anaerolineae bacterium]